MDAVKFLEEKQRMCDTHKHCTECILYKESNKLKTNCSDMQSKFPSTTVQIVIQWSKENPIKTYLDEVKKRLPNILLNKDGITTKQMPRVCPYQLFKTGETSCKHDNCIDCWNREYKEV